MELGGATPNMAYGDMILQKHVPKQYPTQPYICKPTNKHLVVVQMQNLISAVVCYTKTWLDNFWYATYVDKTQQFYVFRFFINHLNLCEPEINSSYPQRLKKKRMDCQAVPKWSERVKLNKLAYDTKPYP